MTMGDPQISVIVPTRDRESLVQRAIRSVLVQTFEDFELIVVDDGSTDATQTAVTAFDDSRIRYLHQPPSGAAPARNRGAAAARGEYLVFLDSDDEAKPRWLTPGAHRHRAALRGAHPDQHLISGCCA